MVIRPRDWSYQTVTAAQAAKNTQTPIPALHTLSFLYLYKLYVTVSIGYIQNREVYVANATTVNLFMFWLDPMISIGVRVGSVYTREYDNLCGD